MPNTLWETYQQVGIKEDIDDVISNISPTKTPFQSLIGRDTADNTLFQWQEDTLRAVAANAQPEGFVASATQPVPTVMRNNRTQILTETVSVTGTSDAVAHYGRAKESAYQLSKSMAQVKRDLENALVGTAQAAAAGAGGTGGAPGTARSMAGYQAQLLNTGASPPNATNSVAYTGAVTLTAALLEPALLSVLQQLYTNGAEPSVLMVTPKDSIAAADLAKNNSRQRTIETGSSDRRVVNVVDVYVSPFGEQRVVINRFLKSTNSLVFEPDMWKMVSLRSWFRETLAKTGDSTQMMIVGEYSLKHRNFAASGAIVQATGPTGF